jgi:signal transduction histidine kinase
MTSTFPHLTDVSLLRTALDCAPGGLILLETLPEPPTDFRIALFNQAAEKLVGQPEATVVGKRARTALSHLVPERLWPVAAQASATGEAYHEPLWITLPDLTRRRYDLTFCPHPNGVAVSFQDITAFEQQKALLESVVEHSPSGMVVEKALRDEAGDVMDFQAVLINPKALEFGQHTREEALAQTIRQLNPQFESSGLLEAYRNVLTTGKPFRVEFFHEPVQRWLELSASRIDEGQLVVLFNDTTERHRAAREVERQRTLLDGVINSSLSAISVWESVRDEGGQIQDFKLTLINETALATSPLPRERIERAKTLLELYPTTKTTGTFAQRVAVVETGVPFRGEIHYAEFDQWYDVSMSKLDDGVVVTYLDITDRKRAELALQDQVHLLDGAMGGLLSGLSVLEVLRDESGRLADLRYLAVSEGVVNDTGLRREQLVNSTMLSLFPSVRETVYWAAYQSALDTGEAQHFEIHYTGEGLDNWLNNAVYKLDDHRLISVYTLVNEQKRALRQAEEQTARLRAVLDGTQNPIVLFEAIRDEQGTIVDYRYVTQNEANSRMVGVPMDQLPHRTALGVLPSLKPTGIFDRYVTVTETGQPQRFETPIHDGNVDGWFDLSVVKLGDGVVVSASDQSLLRQALANSERLVEELRRSNADLEQFAYVASHDLQEPLRKITSFGERIDKKFGEALGPDGRLYLERMRDTAARMSLLINNLLAFSRLTRRSDALTPTDLNAVVQNALNDLEMKISETKATFSTTHLPTIGAVPGQMQQLFQNLLANALKFTKPGVSPEIHLSAEPLALSERDAHHLDAGRRYVKITLRDNGIGFKPEFSEQIFVIFQRLHGRAEYEGTGIGLAIVKKIVENHGGAIWAESQPGEGSAFFVVLPEK